MVGFPTFVKCEINTPFFNHGPTAGAFKRFLAKPEVYSYAAWKHKTENCGASIVAGNCQRNMFREFMFFDEWVDAGTFQTQLQSDARARETKHRSPQVRRIKE
jgi:hypothetical protein